MAGLQGSGKTTATAKLARWFKSQGRQPLLVGADLPRNRADVRLAGPVGRACEQLVGGVLEGLVAQRVRQQLARRVGLHPGEGEESLALGLHHHVLELARRGVALLEELPREPLVALRLLPVLAQRLLEARLFRCLRRLVELGEGLHLDRVRVGDVLRQLLVDVGGHVSSSFFRIHAAPTRAARR